MTTRTAEDVEPRSSVKTEVLDELGKRAYSSAKSLCSAAKSELGLDEQRLDPNAQQTITLGTATTELQIRPRWVGDKNLYFISFKYSGYGEQEYSFESAAHFDEEGKMYAESDSAQGPPWLEITMELEELIQLVDRLENFPDEERVRIDVNFTSFSTEIEPLE